MSIVLIVSCLVCVSFTLSLSSHFSLFASLFLSLSLSYFLSLWSSVLLVVCLLSHHLTQASVKWAWKVSNQMQRAYEWVSKYGNSLIDHRIYVSIVCVFVTQSQVIYTNLLPWFQNVSLPLLLPTAPITTATTPSSLLSSHTKSMTIVSVFAWN